MTRIIYRVQHIGTDWHVGGDGVPKPLRWHQTKTAAVALAVLLAKLVEARGGLSQVVIHKQDGKIQEERTYPRSSDPKRSKG